MCIRDRYKHKNICNRRIKQIPVVAVADDNDAVLTVLIVEVVKVAGVPVVTVDANVVVPIVVRGELSVLGDSVVTVAVLSVTHKIEIFTIVITACVNFVYIDITADDCPIHLVACLLCCIFSVAIFFCLNVRDVLRIPKLI